MGEGADVRLRPAEEADLEALVELHAQLVELHPYFVPYNRAKGREALAGALAEPDRLVLVAEAAEAPGVPESDGKPVALINIVVRWSDWWGVHQGWIDDLYVAPGWRRRGIGRRLTKAALEWLEARDVLEVGVRTDPDLPGAERLYEALGFHRRQVELYRRYRAPLGGCDWPERPEGSG